MIHPSNPQNHEQNTYQNNQRCSIGYVNYAEQYNPPFNQNLPLEKVEENKEKFEYSILCDGDLNQSRSQPTNQ